MSGSKQEFFIRQDVVFAECGDEEERRIVGEVLLPVQPGTVLAPPSFQDVIFASTSNTASELHKAQTHGPCKKRKAVSDHSIVDSNPVSIGSDDGGGQLAESPAPREEAQGLEMTAELFTGLIFYFIPNSRINMARNLRMKRVEDNGGIIADEFDVKTVTHIVVDKNLNAAIVCKATKVPSFPSSMIVVNEFWTPDCVIYNHLLPIADKYSVHGMSSLQSATADPNKIVAKIDEQSDKLIEPPQSLQLKPRAAKRFATDTASCSTPARDSQASFVKSTISPTIAFASSQTRQSKDPERVVEQNATAEKNDADELDHLLSTIRALGHVRLVEEQGLDATEAGASNISEYKDGDRLVIAPESRFKCMQTVREGEANTVGPNDFVISKLRIMQDFYEVSKSPEDKWKPRGYRIAIGVLRSQKEEIKTYEAALALPGIGTRLAQHIAEIAKTGTFAKADMLDADYKLLQRFMGIYGVGPVMANEFFRRGFRSLEDILEHGNLNRNQKIGIELYDDLNTRIPRHEVHEHKVIVAKAASRIAPDLHIHLMGSYRRGAPDCGDIDLMLTMQDASKSTLVSVWQKLLNVLTTQGFLTHALLTSSSKDGLKWQGISRLDQSGARHRRIDFLLVPWEQRGPALLYFTGNDIFNRSMRLLARKKGYCLNEKALLYGTLRQGSKKLTTGQNTGAQTEEEIFQILGVPYRRPSERSVS